MNGEMNMLLKLTEEVTEYRTFFNILSAKIQISEDKKRSYLDVDEIKPLVDAFNKRNKEINVIKFDNCEDVAYAFPNETN